MRKSHDCQFRVKTRERDDRTIEHLTTKPASSHYVRFSKSRAATRPQPSVFRDFTNVPVENNIKIVVTKGQPDGQPPIELEKLQSSRMRLAFTQLFYILNTNGHYNQLISQSLRTLIKKVTAEYRKIFTDFQKASGQLKRIAQLQSEIDKLKQKQQIVLTYPATTHKQLESERMRLLIENNKLGHANQILIKKLNQIKNDPKGVHSDMPLNSHREVQLTEELRDRIKYLTLKISSQETIKYQLSKKQEQAQRKILVLTQTLNQLKEDHLRVSEQLCQWRQRAMMQRQQTETRGWRQEYLMQSLRKLNDMNRKFTSRTNSTIVLDKKQVAKAQRNPLFSYELDFFKSIRSMYDENKKEQYRFNLKGKADQLGLEFDGLYLQTDYSKFMRNQDIQLPQYSYFRPAFFRFIQDSNHPQTLYRSPNIELSRCFIQKMRCIMLCKLNEFQLSDDVSRYTRFPQFVYSWFQNYDFDTDKNDIAILQLKEDRSAVRKFYQQLMNVKLDQSWQVIAFREFLLEQMTLQELYFYLQCQNMLFRRGGVSRQQQLLGELSITVEYQAAKQVLDLVLAEFDSWNLNFLSSKLSQKIILRNNQQFIDSAYFLRCLLEYYKIERANRLRLFRKMHQDLLGQDSNASPSFPQFIRILDRFTDVPLETKVRIYRDCYSVGRGTITPEVIFTVCTEERMFLKHLRLKGFYKLPIQMLRNTKNNEEIWTIQPNLPYLDKIFKKMKDFLSDGSSFWSQTLHLGVQQIVSSVQTFRKYFNFSSRCGLQNSVMKCRHFLHWLSELTIRIRQLSFKNLYDILDESDRRPNRLIIQANEQELGAMYYQQFESQVLLFSRSWQVIEWKRRVQQFRLDHAARKIQRFVRLKFIRPYMNIYTVMLDKVKKLRSLNGRRK